MKCEVCDKEIENDWRSKTSFYTKTPLRFCSIECSRKHNGRIIIYENAKCEKCETEIKRRKGSSKKLCDNCYTRARKKRTGSTSKAVQRKRLKLKEMSLEYKGSKCSVCGYSRYIGALQFHHLNPKEKDFGLSQRGLTRSWGKIKIELDKCVLVCGNCHAEIHAGLIEV